MNEISVVLYHVKYETISSYCANIQIIYYILHDVQSKIEIKYNGLDYTMIK